MAHVLVAPSALTQPASPAASPAAGHALDVLFIQTFERGSMVRQGAASDMFTLTLEGVATTTVYFSERPERIAGLVDTADFVDDRVFSSANPPNAALAAMAEGGQEVIVVDLRTPRYEPTTRVAIYDASPIADYEREGLAFLARMQTDTLLDATFAAGNLFVDQIACQPSGSVAGRCSDCCSSPNCAMGPEGIGYECL